MKTIIRLITLISCLAFTSLFTGCSDGFNSTSSSILQLGGDPNIWSINPELTFIVGSTTNRDLAATLPANIVRGGIFSIDSAGMPLPPGMTLSASGVLSVNSTAVSNTNNVIFSYTEPGN